jgi:hypothetical protein
VESNFFDGCVLKLPHPHKGFFWGKKKGSKVIDGHSFWLGLTPPPNPFIGVYASIALFFFGG